MLAAWSEIYSDSALWRTVILYLHVGGLLVGGGCAVAMDRLTLLASPDDAYQLRAIAGVHRVVIGGLAALFLSGGLMFAANFDTYFVSPYYWTKMALVALLLLNGVRLARAEQDARAGVASGWPRLRAASTASLVLWLSIALFGAILPNV
jgi:hypothetical protein